MKESEETINSERYELKNVIGRGTWGTVYAAHDKVTDQKVAIKILTPTILAQEQMNTRNLDPVKAMRKEGNLVAARHVLPRVMELDNNGRPFIVMPICRGTLEEVLKDKSSIRNCINNGYPDKEKAYGYMVDIVTGLDELHTEYSRAHGDLKLDNIMLSERGGLVINDLGTSTAISLGWSASPRDNMGFIQTRAPELFKEGSHPDRYSDSYAVGSIFYRMFSGEYPLEQELMNAKDPLKYLEDLGSKRFDQIVAEKVKRNIPKEFRRLIKKSLHHHPYGRFAEGKIMKRELEQCIRETQTGYQLKKTLRKTMAAILVPAFILGVLKTGNVIDHYFPKPDLPPRPTLTGPLYLTQKPGEKSIAFDIEDLKDLEQVESGFLIDNQGIDRNAAHVTEDRTTAYLLAQYWRACLSRGLLGGKPVNDHQIKVWSAYGPRKPGIQALSNEYLLDQRQIARNIEVALHEASKSNGNIDLEDMCVITRLGKETLYKAKESSKSFEFARYITAKDETGKYIIPENEQYFLKKWLSFIHDIHKPFP